MYCVLILVQHCYRTYDTSLVVSGGFFAREDNDSVYDKKPQRYAKDYRTQDVFDRTSVFVAVRRPSATFHHLFWRCWLAIRPVPTASVSSCRRCCSTSTSDYSLDTLDVLCAQLTRDLFATAKFLVYFIT